MSGENVIGIIPMSGKPVHRGHDALINIAKQECDTVLLYVGCSTRENIDEEAMVDVWNDYLLEHYEGNDIAVFLLNKSPVGFVYEILGIYNERYKKGKKSDFKPTYRIYGDDEDLPRNFPEKSLKKYLGNLLKNKKVSLRPVQRSQTVEISGTMMRKWLADDEKQRFFDGLPEWLTEDAKDGIWNRLRS